MSGPEPPPEREDGEEQGDAKLPELHSIHQGTVASIRPFGAFIRIGKGDVYKDGLVHISNIASGRVRDVSDFLDLGEKVWAKVANLKEEEGKYGLDLRYVNQATGEDLDPKNREGRLPTNGGKQKKKQTEDLVQDAKSVMDEVKRMKKENKLKKKFLKLEEKRKKKLQKKMKKKAEAQEGKKAKSSSSSSSSSTSSLSEGTQARLRKEFGFPEPKGKAKAAEQSGGITLKERSDVDKMPADGKERKRAREHDLEGLEHGRREKHRNAESPARERGSRQHRARRKRHDSRDDSRDSRRVRRDSRRDSRRARRRGHRADSRDSRRGTRGAHRDSRRPSPEERRGRENGERGRGDPSQHREISCERGAGSQERLSSRERARLNAKGAASEEEEPPKPKKTKGKAGKESKAEKGDAAASRKAEVKSKKSRLAEADEGEPDKKAKRSKK